MKKQVVVIHGGETFGTYEEYLAFLKGITLDFAEEYGEQKRGWRYSLQEELGGDFEVVLLRMPSKMNAKYVEWKIWFDKHIPLLREEVILIGHSLGGLFLAKYLSEETLPITVAATFLVAAPFSEQGLHGSLADFLLSKNVATPTLQSRCICIMHSKDDFVVPFNHAEKYKEMLPRADVVTFEGRGHFLQDLFPELVSKIKEITN